MVRDDERHLPVRQRGQLRPAGRPGGGNEPAGMVVVHRDGRDLHAEPFGDERVEVGRVQLARPHARDERQVGNCLADRRRMPGKLASAQQRAGARRCCDVGDVRRKQPEVGGHPDCPDPEAGVHGFEHQVAVLGLHQDTVAVPDPVLGQHGGERGHPGVELQPIPPPATPDQRGPVRETSRRLGHEPRQVHDPAGHRQARADGHYRTRSSMDT